MMQKSKKKRMTADEFLNNSSELEGETTRTASKISQKKSKVKNQSIKKVKANKGDNKLKAPADKMKPIKKSLGKLGKKTTLKLRSKELESLKEFDPEFYTFLKKNDKKLLDFNLDDSENDDDVGSEAEEEQLENGDSVGDEIEDENQIHKPIKEFEAASDESDFETGDDDDDDEPDQSKTITLKKLRMWQTKLESTDVDLETIRNVIQAFSSALASLSGKAGKLAVYKVGGGAVFNGILQLCLLHLQPAIYHYLNLKPKSNLPLHKCKKWKRIRGCLRNYLLDLTKLLEHVSSNNILTVLLKHLHQIGNTVSSFATISKSILKRLIVLWSTSEETVRVLSFLCILKITRDQQATLLNHVLKAMYLSYVRNAKFVSPTTLPGINFMRRSLVEMFALDLNVSYQHVFLYIRQLAIHLRNAIILKKKDSMQSVYNWQYINSIRLWTDLLGATAGKQQLQPLIYPLVSITTGVIKLVPTAQFFPLRFHCIQALITLSKQTNTFIPVLPFILEVLNSNTFNKKHTIVSMKPMSFTCILRLNKSQMAENGFRDEIVENICGLALEYLAHESSSLAYSDLVVPAVVHLKQYLKNCKNANYSRKIKQLLDKIIENSKFVDQEKRKINFSLKDTSLIQSWEATVRNKSTPLNIYNSSWVKTLETKRKRQAANTDDINDYNLPVVKRKRVDGEASMKNANDGKDVELFPDSDEEDEDIDEKIVPQDSIKRRNKKMPKKLKSVEPEKDEENDFVDDGVDIVKDLDLDDW